MLPFLKQLLEHRGLLGFRHCPILVIDVCSNVFVAVLGMVPCKEADTLCRLCRIRVGNGVMLGLVWGLMMAL